MFFRAIVCVLDGLQPLALLAADQEDQIVGPADVAVDRIPGLALEQSCRDQVDGNVAHFENRPDHSLPIDLQIVADRGYTHLVPGTHGDSQLRLRKSALGGRMLSETRSPRGVGPACHQEQNITAVPVRARTDGPAAPNALADICVVPPVKGAGSGCRNTHQPAIFRQPITTQAP